MLTRTSPIRRTRVRAKRYKPRRGRLHDPAFLSWLHAEQRCAVHGVGRCESFTVHHVRFCGSPKNDRRVLGLCAALHLYEYGEFSIERLHKDGFERHHGISIEAEIARYNADYAAAGLQYSSTV